LGNTGLATDLHFFAQHAGKEPDAALAATLISLDPNLTLQWRDRTLSRQDFETFGEPTDFPNTELARSVLLSGLTGWISNHSPSSWLKELAANCTARSPYLVFPMQIPTPLQWWWLLATPETLQRLARRAKAQYYTSKNERIAHLLKKDDLSDIEALMIAATPSSEMLNAEDAWAHLLKKTANQLAELELKTRLRPCTRMHLEAVRGEHRGILAALLSEREQLRKHQVRLLEPPEIKMASDVVSKTLREAFAAYDLAQASVRNLKTLVKQGHIERATSEAAKVRRECQPFSDLSLDFLDEGKLKYKRHRKTLITAATAIAIAIITSLALAKFLEPSAQIAP
jgi:hypothetical protein